MFIDLVDRTKAVTVFHRSNSNENAYANDNKHNQATVGMTRKKTDISISYLFLTHTITISFQKNTA